MGTLVFTKSYRAQAPDNDFIRLDKSIIGRVLRWSEFDQRPFGSSKPVKLTNLSPGGAGFTLEGRTLPKDTVVKMTISAPDKPEDTVSALYKVRRVDSIANNGYEVGVGLFQIERQSFNQLMDFIKKLTA